MPLQKKSLPFSFTSNSRAKSEAEYNAKIFKSSLKEFTRTHELISPGIEKLHKSSTLAEASRQRLQDGRDILIRALKTLQEMEDTGRRVNDAKIDLEDVQRTNAIYFTKGSDKLASFFDERVRDEEKAQKKKHDEVRRATRAFKRLCVDWNKDKKGGDGYRSRTSKVGGGPKNRKDDESRSDAQLRKFFVYAFRILQTKSISCLMAALCIWQHAYDSSVAIASAYDEKKISKLKSKSDSLVQDTCSEGQKGADPFRAANVYVIRDPRVVQRNTAEMFGVKETFETLKLDRTRRRQVRCAKQELDKALKDMTDLRRRVEPLLPERSKSLFAGKDEDFDESPRPRKLIKKIFTRNKPDADSSDSSEKGNTPSPLKSYVDF